MNRRFVVAQLVLAIGSGALAGADAPLQLLPSQVAASAEAPPALGPNVGGSDFAFEQAAPRRFESPRWFALEFKFSPYAPKIDHSAGLKAGSSPFADLFTSQANPNDTPARKFLFQAEFDVEIWKKFGVLGVGVTAGYYGRKTNSFDYVNGNENVPCTIGVNCVRSGDFTTLNIIPMSALAIYRFDYMAEKWHIPIIPYFKGGIAYYIWIIQNGAGDVATATIPDNSAAGSHTLKGYGGSFGFVLNPGIAVRLDFLEPSTARTLDHEVGINHVYLFCELHYANVNGFGASNKMDLSDTTLNSGIGFEF